MGNIDWAVSPAADHLIVWAEQFISGQSAPPTLLAFPTGSPASAGTRLVPPGEVTSFLMTPTGLSVVVADFEVPGRFDLWAVDPPSIFSDGFESGSTSAW